jgi:hypothetical protein
MPAVATWHTVFDVDPQVDDETLHRLKIWADRNGEGVWDAVRDLCRQASQQALERVAAEIERLPDPPKTSRGRKFAPLRKRCAEDEPHARALMQYLAERHRKDPQRCNWTRAALYTDANGKPYFDAIGTTSFLQAGATMFQTATVPKRMVLDSGVYLEQQADNSFRVGGWVTVEVKLRWYKTRASAARGAQALNRGQHGTPSRWVVDRARRWLSPEQAPPDAHVAVRFWPT